jgi:hypothetical protein
MNEPTGAKHRAPPSRVSADVESCTFRHSVRLAGEDEVAQCRLLQQITGADDHRFCTVPGDACRACVQAFPPTVDDVNPVVASLLLTAAEQIIASGGTNGCDEARARMLVERAEECLPVVAPDDDDCALRPAQTAMSLRPIEELLPVPGQRSLPDVREWAIGVTTASRRLSTLADCLDSLSQAGWPEPRLFADSRIAIPKRFSQLPVTWREPLIGAWPNYYLALAELYLRQPHADAFLLLQDDALLFGHSGLRAYLERILWPGPEPGIVSLFCSRSYTQPTHGWHRFDGSWVWCALAFIFSNEAAKRFLADRSVVEHRSAPGRDGLTKIDILIGAWAHERKVPIYYPTPSLVQHIGQVSTLWPVARAVGTRRADRFAGDLLQ